MRYTSMQIITPRQSIVQPLLVFVAIEILFIVCSWHYISSDSSEQLQNNTAHASVENKNTGWATKAPTTSAGFPEIDAATKDEPSKTLNKENIKQERRKKLHHCFFRNHSYKPGEMLKKEFGFNLTDAIKYDDWDIVFGGYPHCGSKRWDWNMETGLNAKLNERGWDALKPHQIWFPCMGCAHSFCNKRELCRIQRQIDPGNCYLFPDDKEELLAEMKSEPGKLWVLKRDAHDLHLHMSNGVSFIDSLAGLPDDEEGKDDTYLVQRYAEPLLGQGVYRRKSEVRFYLTITSVTPLRAYVYDMPFVGLSQSLYMTNSTASSELHKKCMHDSHPNLVQCKGLNSKLPAKDKFLLLGDYGVKVNISEHMQQSIVVHAKDHLTAVMKNSKEFLGSHKVNRGIAQSGASCFSFMRADFGISHEGKPFLYEINEFPFANEKFTAGKVQSDAYRDLFNMIGLADTPLSTTKSC